MADCYYEIHVKGTKKACYAFLTSAQAADDYEILKESGSDTDYILHFKCCCNVALDYDCVDEYFSPVNVEKYTLDELKNTPNAVGLKYVITQLKTKILGVVAEVNECMEGDGYKYFTRYDNGEILFEEESELDYDAEEETDTSDEHFTF